VLLDGAVVSVEEAAPVVSDYIGSDDSRLGRNGDAPGGLPHGVLLGDSPLRVELVEELAEFAEFVEDELGRRRDLGRGIHGGRVPRIDGSGTNLLATPRYWFTYSLIHYKSGYKTSRGGRSEQRLKGDRVQREIEARGRDEQS
jgi:hypothetical protein